METDNDNFQLQQVDDRDFGEKSFILSSDSGAQIHEENVRQLRQMTEKDIQDQRQQLMESMGTKPIITRTILTYNFQIRICLNFSGLNEMLPGQRLLLLSKSLFQ